MTISKIYYSLDIDELNRDLVQNLSDGYFDDLEDGYSLEDSVSDWIGSNISSYGNLTLEQGE